MGQDGAGWLSAVAAEISPIKVRLGLLFLVGGLAEPLVLGERHGTASAGRVDLLAGVGYLLLPWLVALWVMEEPRPRLAAVGGQRTRTVKWAAILLLCLVMANAAAALLMVATRLLNGSSGAPVDLFFLGINAGVIVLAGVTALIYATLEREVAVKLSGQVALIAAAAVGFVAFFSRHDPWMQRLSAWHTGMGSWLALVVLLGLTAWAGAVGRLPLAAARSRSEKK